MFMPSIECTFAKGMLPHLRMYAANVNGNGNGGAKAAMRCECNLSECTLRRVAIALRFDEGAEIRRTYRCGWRDGQQHRQFLQILQVYYENAVYGRIYRDIRVVKYVLQIRRPIPLKQIIFAGLTNSLAR